VSGPLPTYAQTRGGPDTQVTYTLDSASQNTKLKPKISAVSPMKVGGGHIGRSH
jgi:hypothetical protein